MTVSGARVTRHVTRRIEPVVRSRMLEEPVLALQGGAGAHRGGPDRLSDSLGTVRRTHANEFDGTAALECLLSAD